MKKTIVLMLAVVAVAAAGCQKKEQGTKTPAMPAQQMPANVPGGAPGANPHAGLKPMDIPAGAGHKGKVVETMNSGGYTYVQIDENGQKLWVAVMETKVNKGEVVEFPDSPPMLNFQSKTLKRTFDKIIFAPGLRIVGK